MSSLYAAQTIVYDTYGIEYSNGENVALALLEKRLSAGKLMSLVQDVREFRRLHVDGLRAIGHKQSCACRNCAINRAAVGYCDGYLRTIFPNK